MLLSRTGDHRDALGHTQASSNMADDWEDWENDDFTPQLPAAPAANPVAAADDLEVSKFAGEDEEEEQPKYNVPKPQQVCIRAVQHTKSN